MEVHTDDPVEKEKLINEYAQKEAKRQRMTAIGVVLTVILVLGIAAVITS